MKTTFRSIRKTELGEISTDLFEALVTLADRVDPCELQSRDLEDFFVAPMKAARAAISRALSAGWRTKDTAPDFLEWWLCDYDEGEGGFEIGGGAVLLAKSASCPEVDSADDCSEDWPFRYRISPPSCDPARPSFQSNPFWLLFKETSQSPELTGRFSTLGQAKHAANVADRAAVR